MLRGELFTRYFFDDGIRGMDQYRRLAAIEVADFSESVRTLWANLEEMPHPSKAETEAKFAIAAPTEKARLQERAEVLREWITPKSDPSRPSSVNLTFDLRMKGGRPTPFASLQQRY